MRQRKGKGKTPVKELELCDVCSHILELRNRNRPFDDLLHLGSPQKIAQRSCRLCKLTLRLLQQSGVNESESEATVTLNPRFSDGHLGISYNHGSPEEAVGWVSIIDISKETGEARSHTADYISSLNLSDISPEQITSWITECRRTHGPACNGEKSTSVGREPKDLILVDVFEEKLVFAEPQSDYVAMSYVWGDIQGRNITKTKSSTISSLQTEGSLRSLDQHIPPVVRDSMELCRLIGQRYLWCDMLCIIDDDPECKHTQIGQMDAIYDQANLTLVAISGTDSSQPLPGVRPGSRNPICLVEDLGQELLIVGRAPCLAQVEKYTVYESRGWTFQERLISRRCLFLSDRQVYFQCPSASFREDERVQFLHKPDRGDLSALNTQSDNIANYLSKTKLIEAYETLLRRYTGRQLSYASDRLKAFEGIAQILGQKFQCELWEGLPQTDFWSALLWRPATPFHGRNNTSKTPVKQCSPSWSWGAWSGRILHNHPAESFTLVKQIRAISGIVTTGSRLLTSSPLIEWCYELPLYRVVLRSRDYRSLRRSLDFVDSNDSYMFARDFIRPSVLLLKSFIRSLHIDMTSSRTQLDDIYRRGIATLSHWNIIPTPTVDEFHSAMEFITSRTHPGSIHLPAWPFLYLNAFSCSDETSGFHRSLYHWEIQNLLAKLNNFLRPLPDFHDFENLYGLMASSMLTFFAPSLPFSHFSVENGQLFEFQDSKLRQLTTRDCRLMYDTRRNSFEETLSISHRKATEEPMTVVFKKNGGPCGVLFDTESNLKDRIQNVRNCSWIVISTSGPHVLRELECYTVLRVMLVENFEGHLFRRITVGCINDCSDPFSRHRCYWAGYSNRYVRLV